MIFTERHIARDDWHYRYTPLLYEINLSQQIEFLHTVSPWESRKACESVWVYYISKSRKSKRSNLSEDFHRFLICNDLFFGEYSQFNLYAPKVILRLSVVIVGQPCPFLKNFIIKITVRISHKRNVQFFNLQTVLYVFSRWASRYNLESNNTRWTHSLEEKVCRFYVPHNRSKRNRHCKASKHFFRMLNALQGKEE